jgi:polar amino acid transport system substrate-binding protein
MVKKCFLVAVVLLLAAGLAFAGGKPETGGKLVVGTSAGFPPFEYMEFGKVTGFDIDLMKEIGARLGMEVEVKDMDFDALIEAVSTGTIDVIAAGMTITAERAQRVDFTDPYYIADQSVLVRKDSKIKITADAEINSAEYTIGVQNDTTGGFWVDENAPQAVIKKYGKYIECVQDLDNQNLDMIVVDKPVGETFAKNRDVKVLYTIKTDETYGLAVKKGSELLDPINRELKKLMGSKTWTELINKYFGE